MKNIFFILFIIAGGIYAYGSIENIEILKTIGVFSMSPCLLIYYLFNAKKISLRYTLAIVVVFFADISFQIEPNNILREALTIGFYIIINALISFIIIERNNFIGIKRSVLLSLLLGLIFIVLDYLVFKDSQVIILSSGVYFVSLSILCSFSISFYTKTKSKESLFFLIGTTSHIFASFAKGFEYIYNTPQSIIAFVLFYGICNYFYANAIVLINTKEERL